LCASLLVASPFPGPLDVRFADRVPRHPFTNAFRIAKIAALFDHRLSVGTDLPILFEYTPISTLLYGMRQSGASALLHLAFLIDLRYTVSAICMTPSPKRFLIKGVAEESNRVAAETLAPPILAIFKKVTIWQQHPISA